MKSDTSSKGWRGHHKAICNYGCRIPRLMLAISLLWFASISAQGQAPREAAQRGNRRLLEGEFVGACNALAAQTLAEFMENRDLWGEEPPRETELMLGVPLPSATVSADALLEARNPAEPDAIESLMDGIGKIRRYPVLSPNGAVVSAFVFKYDTRRERWRLSAHGGGTIEAAATEIRKKLQTEYDVRAESFLLVRFPGANRDYLYFVYHEQPKFAPLVRDVENGWEAGEPHPANEVAQVLRKFFRDNEAVLKRAPG